MKFRYSTNLQLFKIQIDQLKLDLWAVTVQ